jgi:hypothetical protein
MSLAEKLRERAAWFVDRPSVPQSDYPTASQISRGECQEIAELLTLAATAVEMAGTGTLLKRRLELTPDLVGKAMFLSKYPQGPWDAGHPLCQQYLRQADVAIKEIFGS